MGGLFILASIATVTGAVLMVGRRNPIYSLLFLLISFIGAAGVFYSLNAPFVAISQVLVYAGAIAVLFLFVLMFINLRRQGEDMFSERVNSLAVYEPAAVEEQKVQESSLFIFQPGAAIMAACMFAVFAAVIGSLPESFSEFDPVRPFHTLNESGGVDKDAHYFGSMREFGKVMIQDFPLHYEVVGLIVLVGVMGAVVLAKRTSEEQETKQVETPTEE